MLYFSYALFPGWQDIQTTAQLSAVWKHDETGVWEEED